MPDKSGFDMLQPFEDLGKRAAQLTKATMEGLSQSGRDTANSLLAAALYPGQVFAQGQAGEMPSPGEMIPGAVNMAQNMLGVGRNIPGPSGPSAGMFVGPKSSIWDPVAADVAKTAERLGIDPSQVWSKTGYGSKLFADKEMRSEISDKGARLDVLPQGQAYLSDILDHPELFEAYPDLANMRVIDKPDSNSLATMYTKKGPSGVMEVNFGKIAEHGDDPLSVMLHEIQHHIDYKEGFARGGSPEEFMPKGTYERLGVARAAMKQELARVLPDAAYMAARHDLPTDFYSGPDFARNLDHIVQTIDKHGEIPADLEHELAPFARELSTSPVFKNYREASKAYHNYKNIYDQAFDKYESLAGEEGARLTQRRQDLSPEERSVLFHGGTRDVLPPSSYHFETPPEQQIVLKTGQRATEK